jgi:hypothetical protein
MGRLLEGQRARLSSHMAEKKGLFKIPSATSMIIEKAI